MNKQRIAVLGAGPMGLAVAYQLARDGHSPVVFEADDRIGGMTAAFDFSGLSIERYYHFHCISDHAFLKILDEFKYIGIEVSPVYYQKLVNLKETTENGYTENGYYPAS